MMRAESRRLLVIGTGTLAPELAEAHAAIHPFPEIEICGRSLARAESVASGLSARLPAKITASADIPAAVARADVIAAATSAMAPFIRAADVRPGTHLGLIGAFTPHMAEAEGQLLARAVLYADTIEGVLSKGGEVLLALNQGLFGPEHIKGDLPALLRSAVSARNSESEITVFKSVGHAAQDLAFAEFVLAQCEAARKPEQ
jgi:ornithine cyclodeaminase